MATVEQQRRTPVARPAAKSDAKWMADVLARAFWDDPVFTWLHPRVATRYAALRRFFLAEVRMSLRRGRILTTDDLGAVSVWAPPGKWKTPPLDAARMAPSGVFLAHEPVVAAKFFFHMEKQHPTEPHWYLATLGSDPGRKGSGSAKALLETVLGECDRDGLPAYLESSKFENVGYYERFGFEVTGEIQVGDSPTLWSMWRPVK